MINFKKTLKVNVENQRLKIDFYFVSKKMLKRKSKVSLNKRHQELILIKVANQKH